MSPWGDVLGLPIWEDTPGKPRTRQRDYISGFGRLGNVLLFPWKTWWKWPGYGTSGSPFSDRCPRDPDSDKRQKSDERTLELQTVHLDIKTCSTSTSCNYENATNALTQYQLKQNIIVLWSWSHFTAERILLML